MYSNLLLQLTVFFLPTQLGLHFWPEFSRAGGLKIDYLSPTLYLTDIFILLYLLFNLSKLCHSLVQKHSSLTLLFLLVVTNTYFSISPLNTFFWWLRTLIYLLFGYSLLINKVSFKSIRLTFLSSLILIIGLEIGQFIKQSSLDGLWYYLGERTLNLSTGNVAKVSLFQNTYLRPYSTFSHPNSLAGYLLISHFILQSQKISKKIKLLVLFALLLTFSKSALLALMLLDWFRLNLKKVTSTALLLTLLQVSLSKIHFSPDWISARLELIEKTKNFILPKIFFGHGLGNFVTALASSVSGSGLTYDKIQPVHNLFLLSLSEIGLVGLLFVGKIISAVETLKLNSTQIKIISAVIIIGIFDHYFWTLPQNRLILLLGLTILV